MLLVEYARQALLLALTLSTPVLAASLAASVAVGLVAASARVHDATLATLPRQLATAAVLLLLGGVGAGALVRFTLELWRSIPALVR